MHNAANLLLLAVKLLMRLSRIGSVSTESFINPPKYFSFVDAKYWIYLIIYILHLVIQSLQICKTCVYHKRKFRCAWYNCSLYKIYIYMSMSICLYTYLKNYSVKVKGWGYFSNSGNSMLQMLFQVRRTIRKYIRSWMSDSLSFLQSCSEEIH